MLLFVGERVMHGGEGAAAERRYAALAAEGLAEEGDVHALQPVALRLGR